MKRRTVMELATGFCFAVLVAFFVTVGLRFGTRQILIERFGVNNTFTKLIFWGDEKAEIVMDENGEVTTTINWEERYPFATENMEPLALEKTDAPSVIAARASRYGSLIASIEAKIETYTGDLLFGHGVMTRAGKGYNALIGCAEMPMNAGESSNLIFLKNGYLTYREPFVADEELDLLADQVADFSAYLRGQGIWFLYANAGSKVCPMDKELPAGAEEFTNENADRLLERLAERDVDVLDYRPYQLMQFPDWYDSYYITDHHWKTTTGLWAAGVLAAHLNDRAGFQFDPAYFEESQYEMETREHYFLGSQGRALTTALAEPEAFTRILPRYETDFSIQIPTRGVDLRGSYEKTLFRNDFFETIADYTLADFDTKETAYSAARWQNDALGMVQNHMHTDNDGKRLLMIQDSFGWYLSTYLAADVEEIDFIHLRAFTGSIRSYIEQTQPDAVVLLLYEGNIRALDAASYQAHRHFFDFR